MLSPNDNVEKRVCSIFLLELFNNSVTIIILGFVIIPIGQMVHFYHSFDLDDLNQKRKLIIRDSLDISCLDQGLQHTGVKIHIFSINKI